MRARSVGIGCLCLLAIAGLAAGCSYGQPHPAVGWVPRYQDARGHRSGYGAWAMVRYRDQTRIARAEGELLAFEADSTYLLAPQGPIVIPTAAVEHATFVPYQWPDGSNVLERVPAREAEKIRGFARFPRGLPPGLDPRSLRREP